MTRNIYALLVGINEYPGSVPQLEGCVNDIDAIEEFLNERIDRQNYQPHIVKLLDEKATRQAVIDNFEQHLGKAGSNDVALFYYSGHGSQEPAPPEFWHLEPDRMDETLVCWDSRQVGGWDLADKELGYLIAKVARKNPHIVVVLDCCHSGSGTKDVVQSKVRHAPADRRSRKVEDFIFAMRDLEAITSEPIEGLTSGWNLPRGRHILLSACQDREVASEYSGEGKPRGAFSYFLIDTLQKANGTLSYRELFKRASALVRSRIKDQTPQLEATNIDDANLPFLNEASALQKRESYFTLSFDGNQWVIDGGAVHGLSQPCGDPILLALYPQGSNADAMRQLSQAVGEVEVVEVSPHQSTVRFTREVEGLTNETVLNAVIVSLPLPTMGVYFEGDAEALHAVRIELQKAGAGGKSSLYVREVADLNQAQYRLLARNGEYIVTKPLDSLPLIEELRGYTQPNAWRAVQNLEHIARWVSIVELNNPATELPSDAVEMQILQGAVELKDAVLHLSYRHENGKWVAPTFRLKLKNNTNRRLYCTVLDLTEEYSASAPLFSGGGTWIDPGGEVWGFDGKAIPASVPDHLQQGITEYQDILKLIASTGEFDAALLCQDKLNKPRMQHKAVISRNGTLNRLMSRIQVKDIGTGGIAEVDEWTTSQIAIATVRPRDAVPLKQNEPTSLLDGLAIVQPHPGLKADIRLSTVAQASRDLGNQLLPPILRSQTQPFQFTASRGVNPGLSVLELQVSDANASSLETVTRDRPLTVAIEKSLGENEYVLPVAYDGEFFMPLGRGETRDGKTEIHLERLPNPVTEKKKSLGGSIRIFFQKVVCEQLGLEFPYPILAAVEFQEDGTIRYEGNLDIVKQRVTSASKIALFIHGIIGDTQSMVPAAKLAKFTADGQEKSLIDLYDLVLAFDYENLNTSISAIAEQLRGRLQTVGLAENHGKTLHVIAHSMGGLVSRSLIEQKGGACVVQHLILLGTPNAGSPWPTVQDWATTALALGINSLSTVAMPVKVLGSLLATIETVDITLDQMKPGSDFLLSLRSAPDPHVPYTILAGNTSIVKLSDEDTQNRLLAFLQKLGRGAIEFPFIGQPNDIAVTVQSIQSVPKERSPQPVTEEVACNHLVYFTDPAGLQALAKAVVRAMGVTPSLSTGEDALSQTTSGLGTQLEAEVTSAAQTLQNEPDSDVHDVHKNLFRFPIGVLAVLVLVASILGFMLWKRSQQESGNQQQRSQLMQKSSEPIVSGYLLNFTRGVSEGHQIRIEC
jgi:pimeloyl-ACP methyl ester carboxylesterase